MNIVFQINGGLGKSVAATAVCKSIKEKYPDSFLIVLTGHPDVFLNNPNVDRCLKYGEFKYFYKDYLEGKEFIYLGQEPYSTDDYLKSKCSLVEIWCKLYDLPFIQSHGDIYLNRREIDFYSRKYNLDGNYVVMQTSGNSGDMLYNWSRDIPPSFVNKVVGKLNGQKIYHVKNEGQISYDGTIPFIDNIRAVMVLISMSKSRIFMDSSCQHIAAAMGLPSNVFWIATSSKVFGYDFNNNIQANPETKVVSLQNSFLQKYELVSPISDFPYNNEEEVFTTESLNSIIL